MLCRTTRNLLTSDDNGGMINILTGTLVQVFGESVTPGVGEGWMRIDALEAYVIVKSGALAGQQTAIHHEWVDCLIPLPALELLAMEAE